jgi:leucyl-tRNA---protein transferase
MYSRIYHPEKMSAEALDAYLSAGWRCMGQAIYVTHFMFFPYDGWRRPYSTLPTRLPLAGHQFSKSHQKLWRRTQQAFRVETGGKAVFDAEKERVNAAYARLFPDRAIQKPEDFDGSTFDTREVCVWHGGQLAAFSFFDLGKTSIYSKQGIYDPSFQSSSLGFFTMLAEIAFGIKNGVQFYYPGYLVPGVPEFDYKARLGPMEYYHLQSESWRPWQGLQEQDIPINYMQQQLEALKGRLAAVGVSSAIAAYRLFDIGFHEKLPFPFLEFPLFLAVATNNAQRLCPLAVFDPVAGRFHLLDCRFFGQGVNHQRTYQQVLSQSNRLCRTPVAVFGSLAEDCTLEQARDALLAACQYPIG